MNIRPARPRDAEAICEMINHTIRETLITFTTDLKTSAEVSAEITARGPAYLVAEEGAELMGFASFGPFRKGPGYAHTAEHSIQLRPEARGNGMGRALMMRLQDVAEAQGIHVLIAGISSANPDSIGFHAQLGFAEVARMPEVGRKCGQWLDLILMQKILSTDPDSTLSDR